MNKLFIALLGGRPADVTIEAHNVFFGVGPDLESLFPAIKKFWSSAPKIHVDAYMCVEQVGRHKILVERKETDSPAENDSAAKLFFINLGGYRQGVFEEVHKKLLVVAADQTEAVALAKKDSFFAEGIHEGNARPHIDDKKTLDEFEDELPLDVAEMIESSGFRLVLRPDPTEQIKYPAPIITGFWRLP